MSKCASCGSFNFRVQEVAPQGSNFKLNFVQCSICGAPVGVLEYYNLTSMIDGVQKKIANLSSKFEEVNYNLSILQQEIRRKK